MQTVTSWGVLPICDGDTQKVGPSQVATNKECDKCLTAPVPGKAKVAFLSWTYNVGVGAACLSTLVKKANAGDITGACDQLLRWDRAGGKVVRGLTNRRVAERALCLEGVAGK